MPQLITNPLPNRNPTTIQKSPSKQHHHPTHRPTYKKHNNHSPKISRTTPNNKPHYAPTQKNTANPYATNKLKPS